MGCKTSRNIKVDHLTPASSRSSIEKGGFTELHIDVVRSTWPLLNKDPILTGTMIFRILFSQAPELKAVFPYRNVNPNKMMHNKKARNHADKFMKTIGSVVEQLEDLENSEVPQTLILLGAKHARIKNLDLTHLPKFTKCVLLAWESVLRQEYTIDVEAAWTAVLDYISGKLSQGYYFYWQDITEDCLEVKMDEVSTFSVTNVTELSTGTDML